jgi:hypothetical protein
MLLEELCIYLCIEISIERSILSNLLATAFCPCIYWWKSCLFIYVLKLALSEVFLVIFWPQHSVPAYIGGRVVYLFCIEISIERSIFSNLLATDTVLYSK